MSKKSLYDKLPQNEGSNRNVAPRPSEFCTKNQCQEKTDIVFTLVRNPFGKVESGSFGDYAITGQRVLREGYTFIEFVCRCSRCYQEDIDNHNKEKPVNANGGELI